MPKIVETYDYTDKQGNLLYQKVRYKPKSFRQRRPDGNGGWIWDLNGVKPTLYRLPELLEATNGENVFIVEGEEDVDRLHDEGLTATTSGNSNSWHNRFDKLFRGRKVCILPDNDEAGRDYSKRVKKSLRRDGVEVCVIRLPGLEDGEDVSDWLNNGGSKKKLLKLVKEAKLKKPIGQKHKKSKRKIKNRRAARATKETIVRGERNIRLTSEAGRLRSTGLEVDDLKILLLKYNDRHCKPPLDDKEVQQIAESVCRYDDEQPEKLNDAGNSRRFAKQHKDKLRFCWDWNKWLIFDSTHWNCKKGESASIRTAKRTARSIYNEAANCEDDDVSKAIANWASKSSSSFAIKAMLFLAKN